MRMTNAFLAAAFAVLVPLSAHAADAADQLRQFVQTVQSASGAFVQAQNGAADGRQKAPQSGVFSFKRPGQFRWDVQKPYAQLTLSDGKRVYQYDPDLMQVTERGLGTSMGASPAAILFGEGKFDDAFTVSTLPDDDGMAWLRATPRQNDAGFSHVDIGFRGSLPARLLLLDAFGQATRIDLNDIQVNPSLPDDTFRFQVPAGVDVVKMP